MAQFRDGSGWDATKCFKPTMRTILNQIELWTRRVEEAPEVGSVNWCSKEECRKHLAAWVAARMEAESDG